MLSEIGRLTESVYFEDSHDKPYEDTLGAIRYQLSNSRNTLSKLIFKQFEYEKEKFTRDQVHKLFCGAALSLNPNQLDSLFRNLDPDLNGVIFVNALSKALGDSMLESRLSLQSDRGGLWIEQLAKHLRSTGPYQTLQSFDEDSDGVLSL